MDALPPLRLRPEFRRRLWGGDHLPAWLGATAPDGVERGAQAGTEPVAEAWLAYGGSLVEGGPYDGERLGDLIARFGAALVGRAPQRRYGDVMPLLVKFLDAAADLSVQVHPDDAYAARRHPGSGHLGKTETWRVLAAEPEAEIVWGFAHAVAADEVRAAIADGTLGTLLRRVRVGAGDVVHNPAGTVHAVGAGLRIYELQQASDLTYRLWDHGRVGADGRPRDLHVDDALAVADLSGRGEPRPDPTSGTDGWIVRASCPSYRLDERALDGAADAATDRDSMHVLTVLEGRVDLGWHGQVTRLREGATAVVPASAGPYRLTGRATVARGVPGVATPRAREAR